MKFFDGTGHGYYLVQTKDQTCFLAYVARNSKGEAVVYSAVALNSPIGVQSLDADEIYEAVALSDLGIKEVPVDYRDMVSKLWASKEKTFWDYNWLLVDYFNDLMKVDQELLAA